MFKNTLLLLTLLLFAGCGTKPTIIKAGPQNRPIVPKHKPLIHNQNQTTPRALNTPAKMTDNALGGEPVDLSQGETLSKSNSKSYVTTFKTKKFSFSDAGFMRQENGVIDLQILALGKPLLKLKISDDVCVDHHCRTKQEFNADYLSSDYPYDLINNVLTSQPIFGGENLKRTSNGFMQRIQSPLYDIKYKIAPGSIYFKDMQNRIIIKLRELR
jgi:hypothetical protein